METRKELKAYLDTSIIASFIPDRDRESPSKEELQ